jgi:hypothetical protein
MTASPGPAPGPNAPGHTSKPGPVARRGRLRARRCVRLHLQHRPRRPGRERPADRIAGTGRPLCLSSGGCCGIWAGRCAPPAPAPAPAPARPPLANAAARPQLPWRGAEWTEGGPPGGYCLRAARGPAGGGEGGVKDRR